MGAPTGCRDGRPTGSIQESLGSAAGTVDRAKRCAARIVDVVWASGA